MRAEFRTNRAEMLKFLRSHNNIEMSTQAIVSFLPAQRYASMAGPIMVSTKWGYFPLERCPIFWTWKNSPRYVDYRNVLSFVHNYDCDATATTLWRPCNVLRWPRLWCDCDKTCQSPSDVIILAYFCLLTSISYVVPVPWYMKWT